MNHLAEAVDALAKAGIEFTTHAVNGHFTISAQNIPSFLQDPEGYRAQLHGVPRDHYVAWAKHAAKQECPATTRTGNPCQGHVNRVQEPQAFHPGVSEYCVVHQRTGIL